MHVREQMLHVGSRHLVHTTEDPPPGRTADNVLWHVEHGDLDEREKGE